MNLKLLERAYVNLRRLGKREYEFTFPFSGLHSERWLIIGEIDRSLFNGLNCEFINQIGTVLSGQWRGKLRGLRRRGFAVAIASGELPLALYVLPYFAGIRVRFFVGKGANHYPYYNVQWMGSVESLIKSTVF